MIGFLVIVVAVCGAYLFGRWTQIGEQEAENLRLQARVRHLEALLKEALPDLQRCVKDMRADLEKLG